MSIHTAHTKRHAEGVCVFTIHTIAKPEQLRVIFVVVDDDDVTLRKIVEWHSQATERKRESLRVQQQEWDSNGRQEMSGKGLSSHAWLSTPTKDRTFSSDRLLLLLLDAMTAKSLTEFWQCGTIIGRMRIVTNRPNRHRIRSNICSLSINYYATNWCVSIEKIGSTRSRPASRAIGIQSTRKPPIDTFSTFRNWACATEHS